MYMYLGGLGTTSPEICSTAAGLYIFFYTGAISKGPFYHGYCERLSFSMKIVKDMQNSSVMTQNGNKSAATLQDTMYPATVLIIAVAHVLA